MQDVKTFDELQPYEVNDLIATKIMGWTFDESSIENYSTGYEDRFYETGNKKEEFRWLRFRSYEDHNFYPDEYGKENMFDPYRSLDDCHLAEEKLPTVAKFNYIVILSGMSSAERDDGLRYDLIHATAKQKSEALLRAIGAIHKGE